MKMLLLGAMALSAAIAVPGVSLAATFAYVNTAGEVMTVEAATPNAAILTAPGIHPRSGVLLIDGTDDSQLIGDDVPVS
ncbi:MAG TPA: hypothetical protein VFY28_02690 [Candidatus Paceibacterota bacterium]|nr:hypothetical protein [Candidatus Paceibacterota bacterium]